MDIGKEFAPTGTLRVAINVGNGVLTSYDEETGQPGGITVEIANSLADELSLPIELKIFRSAGNVVEAVENGEWDVAFLARDPKRAEVIAFSTPYILIEGSYLVREDSDFLRNEDVDKPGVRIAVGKGAAYDLYLSRNLKHATLERAPTTPGAVDLFLEQNLDVAAGVRQPLNEYAARHDGVRVLPGRFMVIEQAMAVPANRAKAASYLETFVHTLIRSGKVGELITRFDKHQASVPELP
ncbi:MAG: ABC transporter substrate-binding protein [Rhodospirillales bacterium]|jgi:polar amino acid transport system substrate-binding protein|nr:ABC transporter substrate-binding protein [Rhodospirillales bacterium]MBR9816761.1 ABC transporter substrate-binding protein [Rhodospirillales bacterium]